MTTTTAYGIGIATIDATGATLDVRFRTLGWAGVVCGVAFIAISFLVRSWAHEDKPVRSEPEAPAA